MSNSSNTVVGLLAGTVIGATLGILFAPEKGEITRRRIADEAETAKDIIAEKASEIKKQAPAPGFRPAGYPKAGTLAQPYIIIYLCIHIYIYIYVYI